MIDVFEGLIEERDLAKSWNKGKKISTRTLARYRNQPDGLPYIELGGSIYYKIDSVRKWIEARERHPNVRRAA